MNFMIEEGMIDTLTNDKIREIVRDWLRDPVEGTIAWRYSNLRRVRSDGYERTV